MTTSKLKIYVSHVDSPNSFWAQYDDEEHHDMLKGVESQVGFLFEHPYHGAAEAHSGQEPHVMGKPNT